jgi:hypothetical protein
MKSQETWLTVTLSPEGAMGSQWEGCWDGLKHKFFRLISKHSDSVDLAWAKACNIFKKHFHWALGWLISVNPSYSGGRDWEDHCLKTAWANSSVRPYLEKPFTKTFFFFFLQYWGLNSGPSP